MTFDASHALRFINRARAATGLPALTELPFTGAVRVDERACLLARALQAEVGGSADPRFRDHFVVRLGDQALARAVASRTGQPCNDHAEVLLPEPLARLAVAFDRGQVERRAARYVPLGQLSFDDLETAACQAVAVVSDSSAGHEQALSAVHDHHELRRPRGQGRRSADPGGTDAARAARPHDDSLHPNGMAPNQPLRLVPRPRRAVLQAPRARHGAPTERWNVTLDSELAVLHVGSIRRCRRGAAQITDPSLRRSTTEPPAQNRIAQARMASRGRGHRVQVLGTVRTLLRGLHGCACLLRAHRCTGSPVPRAEGARPARAGPQPFRSG